MSSQYIPVSCRTHPTQSGAIPDFVGRGGLTPVDVGGDPGAEELVLVDIVAVLPRISSIQ